MTFILNLDPVVVTYIVESEPLTNKADWADPGNIPAQPLHTQTLHHLSAYIAWLNILLGNSHLEFYFIFRTKS